MSDLARLWGLLRPYRGWMAAGAVAALVTLLANVTLMAVSAWFITAMAVAGASGTALNYFTPAAVIRACAIVRTVGRYGERLFTHEATLRLLAGLRVWFYRHLEPLAPARLRGLHSGDLLSRIRADVDALDNLYVRVLVPVLVAALSAVLFTGFLLLYDPRIAAVGLGFLLLTGVGVPLWSKARGSASGARIAVTESRLRSAYIDGIQGLPELQVFGADRQQAARLSALGRELIADQDRIASHSAAAREAVSLGAHLSLWVLLWLAIPLVQDGRLLPPQMAMLALFTLASFEAIVPLPDAFAQMGRTLVAARRLFSIVDMEPAVREPPGPSPIPHTFDLSLSGVCFSYLGSPAPVLDGVDLELPAGARVAVVGATGAGKSTLFHLLLRSWPTGAGSIRLGGFDLAQFRGEDLSRYFGVVSQHTHLFDASIRENVLIGDPDASAARLDQACETAQLRAFIDSLPEGYDTWVGETGVRLSGGQARRIAIARALLKDAPILLLDEPTEGLDPETERSLLLALDRLMAERTVLLITHRPAALERLDRVLVLGEGRLRERSV